MSISVPKAKGDVEDENGEAKIIIEMVRARKRTRTAISSNDLVLLADAVYRLITMRT